MGQGYAGLTLSVHMAETGMRVLGVDHDPAAREAVRTGRPPFAEPGLEERLPRLAGSGLWVSDRLEPGIPTVVICVGTPVDAATGEPVLEDLRLAAAMVRDAMAPDTLVIVRSTVPVGTTTRVVVPILRERVAEPLVAMCPERTIQGQALEELRVLPQVVGANTPAAAERAAALFATLGVEVVHVSSPSAAEMVKLINNAHTDVIYGFGNEVALMAERLGLDAGELLHAANYHYPRPDLCSPGFVGGSCLTKDPYLLLHSLGPAAEPALVRAARELNASLPLRVWERVRGAAVEAGIDPGRAAVLVAGVAYKGRPATDDMRGSAALPLLGHLRGCAGRLLLHDFEVPAPRLRALGGEPCGLEKGAAMADIVLVLNDHPRYAAVSLASPLSERRGPRVVWDAWGVLEADRAGWPDDVAYLRLGRG